ncbi:unnamed protein product [Dracunculus medinensis]|uniref:SCP domain-containing protein n=1 Tax=Dracunculus medinensis TaxID=318479 RepID=A0A0N4URX0_DRAME|nr:unnamed protein product [Dracunculus medinensis]
MPSEEHTDDEPTMPKETDKPGSSSPVSKITSAGRENFLKKLNDIRTKVAMGQFSTSDGTYPAAKEIEELEEKSEESDEEEESEEELISHEEIEMPSEEHTDDEPTMPKETDKPGSSSPVSKITSAGRENFLKKLNDIRTKVAMGQFSTSDGTYPAAKEMYKLKLAQEHVDKCHYDRSEYFLKYFYGDGVGETLFANWTLENDPKDDILSVAVDEWLKSKPMGETSLLTDKYINSSNENLAQPFPDRHISFQLITARTTEIGCGVSFCEYPQHLDKNGTPRCMRVVKNAKAMRNVRRMLHQNVCHRRNTFTLKDQIHVGLKAPHEHFGLTGVVKRF